MLDVSPVQQRSRRSTGDNDDKGGPALGHTSSGGRALSRWPKIGRATKPPFRRLGPYGSRSLPRPCRSVCARPHHAHAYSRSILRAHGPTLPLPLLALTMMIGRTGRTGLPTTIAVMAPPVPNPPPPCSSRAAILSLLVVRRGHAPPISVRRCGRRHLRCNPPEGGSSTAFRSPARSKLRLGCLRRLARHDTAHAGGG